MASALPTPSECCTTCTDPEQINVPGPAGVDGADGADGTNGLNAFSTVNGGATVIPAYGDDVILPLNTPEGSKWMAPGQIIYLESYGYYLVISLPTVTTAELRNLGNSATGEYTDNVDGNGILTFAGGTRVQPGGLQGPSSSVAPGTYFEVANNLSEGIPATMLSNLGIVIGILDTNIPPVDDAPGLTAGQLVRVTASGLESIDAATALSVLGITIGILDGNIPPVDDTPGLTAGESVWVTAAGLESKTAAAARTALGLSGMVGAYLLFENRLATTVEQGITQGAWRTVPFNTEVSDAGGYGSLAADTFTLAAGTYRVRWRVTCFEVESFQSRLWDVTNGAVIAYGSNAEATGLGVSSVSLGCTRFTIATPTDFIIQAWCELTNLTNGFGKANGFGGSEVYHAFELEREI